MNIPNRLTLSRLILTPFWTILFYIMKLSNNLILKYILVVILALLLGYMEISDVLDGKIARKNQLVSDLGKVFDPFSDSLMHLSFFALFVRFKQISFIAFYLILMRELSIVFVRLILVKCGKSLPANIFGKFKTVFYAVLSIIVILYNFALVFFNFSARLQARAEGVFFILSYLACFFSLLSFFIYLYNAHRSGIFKNISC